MIELILLLIAVAAMGACYWIGYENGKTYQKAKSRKRTVEVKTKQQEAVSSFPRSKSDFIKWLRAGKF